jgi:hypothetical protein
MNPQLPEEQAANLPGLVASNRVICIDQRFDSRAKVTATRFQNHFFQRLVAKDVSFEHVDFSYTIFDTCYLRKCAFQDCNFTGCRFTASNFYGSSFSGCKFDYAVFERTIVDSEILDVGCPGHENLKLKFARTLRTNFQALGDAASANKAIELELAATQEHLWKGWHSPESYYRGKYKGWARFRLLLSWINFKLLDFVWGNGESLWKLGRTILVILVAMGFADVYLMGKNGLLVTNYLSSLLHVPAVFFGIKSPQEYPEIYLTVILAIRLVMVAFFLSVIIKRFSRR